MTGVVSGKPSALVLDTMCLRNFALADRLDVLRDLIIDWECWTTRVVVEELREGSAIHSALSSVCDVDWLRIAELDTLQEIKCFAEWVNRISAGQRGCGEASVFAAAELRAGVALTDDRAATRVARRHGVEVHGTIWLLAAACRDGKLTEDNAGSLIDGVRTVGARLPCTGAEFPGYVRRYNLLS